VDPKQKEIMGAATIRADHILVTQVMTTGEVGPSTEC